MDEEISLILFHLTGQIELQKEFSLSSKTEHFGRGIKREELAWQSGLRWKGQKRIF
jgi:hypothetical protein